MKLGSETGSLINHVLSGSGGAPAKPEVGTAATILHWTDREPATVVRVSPTGKTLWVQADKYTRVDQNGMSESQDYEYARNHTAPLQEFRLTPKRGWRGKGGSPALVLGRQERYHDFSF